MENIDWDKAPEWATMHGYAGPDRHEVWMDDCKYTYCDGRQGGIEFHFGGGFASRSIQEIDSITERPSPSWSGEGLPPVGVVCEVDYCEQWQRCEVIAHFQQRCGMVAAFTVEFGDGAKSLDAFGAESFRPIRTPEQIAADEREAAIKDLISITSDGVTSINMCDAARIYDAGYRKT